MAPSNTPDGVGSDDEAGLGHDDGVQRPEDRPEGRPEDRPDGPPGELGDSEVEARLEDIVARLGHLEAPGARPGAGPGTGPGGDPRDGDRAGRRAPAAPEPGTPARRPPGPRDHPTTPEVEALEEAEGHFTPPEPPPVLASRDRLLVLAWAGATGVPLLAVLAVLVRAFVPLPTPAWLGGAGVAVFVASVAALLWRMPHHRDPGDGPGAVV
jgi:hypothetical protein